MVQKAQNKVVHEVLEDLPEAANVQDLHVEQVRRPGTSRFSLEQLYIVEEHTDHMVEVHDEVLP